MRLKERNEKNERKRRGGNGKGRKYLKRMR
jgi:hypothetical protein